MNNILSKKDYKIIGVSLKKPKKLIIKLDKDEGILKSKNDIDIFLNDL